MKTAAALLALAASASAFTTSKPAAPRTTAMEAAMDDYVGSVNLFGSEFKFDPVSLCNLSTYSVLKKPSDRNNFCTKTSN